MVTSSVTPEAMSTKATRYPIVAAEFGSNDKMTSETNTQAMPAARNSPQPGTDGATLGLISASFTIDMAASLRKRANAERGSVGSKRECTHPVMDAPRSVTAFRQKTERVDDQTRMHCNLTPSAGDSSPSSARSRPSWRLQFGRVGLGSVPIRYSTGHGHGSGGKDA